MDLSLPTKWVCGYQDNERKKENLTWEAQLNVHADELVTEAQLQITRQDHKRAFEIFPACYVYLFINGQPITSNMAGIICNKWCTVELRRDTKERFEWNKKNFESVQMDKSGRIYKNLTYNTNHFITRYTYNCLPLRGEKYSARSDKTCPCCKIE
eukprot:9513887-Ditylum_brightwellii.AAC.1